MNGRPTRVQHTYYMTRHDLARGMAQNIEETKKGGDSSLGRREDRTARCSLKEGRIFDVASEDKEYIKVIVDMDHLSGKGYVSELRYGMVHKPITKKGAMNIPDAMAAVDKSKGQVEIYNSLGLQESEAQGRSCSTSKKEDLISHPSWTFAVLLGDNVKNDSGHRAVFTEQGASASQLAAGTSWIHFPYFLARLVKP